MEMALPVCRSSGATARSSIEIGRRRGPASERRSAPTTRKATMLRNGQANPFPEAVMATRDDPSLEILRTFLLFAEHHGPGEVARQIDRDPAVVSRRLAELREYGLLEGR